MPLSREQQEELRRADAAAVARFEAERADPEAKLKRTGFPADPPPPDPADDTPEQSAHLESIAKELTARGYDADQVDSILTAERKRIRSPKRPVVPGMA